MQAVWRLVRPYRWLLVACVALGTGSAILESASISLFVPLFMPLTTGRQPLPNSVLALSRWVAGNGPRHAQVQWIAGVLLAAIILKNLLGYASRLLGLRIELGTVKDLRTRIFDRYLHSPFQFFLDRRQGRLINDLFGETGIAGQAVSTVLSLLSITTTIAALYVLLICISWQATCAATLTFAVLTIGLQRLALTSRRLASIRQRLVRDFTALTAEAILGIRQVKVFSAEDRLQAGFQRMADQMSQANFRLQILPVLAQPLGEVAAAVVMMVSVMVLNHGSSTAENLLSVVVMVVVILARLLPLVGGLNKELIKLRAEVASVRTVQQLLELPRPQHDQPAGLPCPGIQEAVRLDHVRFAYPGAEGVEVLSEVTLTFPVGQTTVIVGPSGAGKSTIVDLLVRLYDPTAGRVTLDGVDLNTFDIASWRSRIGFVSQDTFIFHASIADNIAFAHPSASESDIRWAAQQADADEFIHALPQGYDTIVGDRGLKLSGGQRQRIAIARAVLRRPDVLLFDEATSALDQESERRVHQAMLRISQGRTVIIVAHRLSMILKAHHIVVLEHGRVAEQGTHEQLVSRRSAYWALQAGGPAIVQPEPASRLEPARVGSIIALTRGDDGVRA